MQVAEGTERSGLWLKLDGKGGHDQMGSCMVLNTEESVIEVGTMSNRMLARPWATAH